MSPKSHLKLKKIHPASIPAALAKAEQFRTLHEGREAESVCRDILRLEPDNQQALILLVQALCDQFQGGGADVTTARRLIARLVDPYEQKYYLGIVFERWAKARHHTGALPDAVTTEYLNQALQCFEEAEALRPPDNDDAILRWNSCIRVLQGDEHLRHTTVDLFGHDPREHHPHD